MIGGKCWSILYIVLIKLTNNKTGVTTHKVSTGVIFALIYTCILHKILTESSICVTRARAASYTDIYFLLGVPVPYAAEDEEIDK